MDPRQRSALLVGVSQELVCGLAWNCSQMTHLPIKIGAVCLGAIQVWTFHLCIRYVKHSGTFVLPDKDVLIEPLASF